MATILRVYSESTRFLIHVRDTTAVVNRMETVYGLRIVDSVWVILLYAILGVRVKPIVLRVEATAKQANGML